MDFSQVVQKIAPCGIDCGRCADYQNGEIKELSIRLLELLKGYERVAKVKSRINPAFEKYDKFKEVLEIFADASCGSCRSDNEKCPIDCHAKTCHKDKKVDFCFQCDEFPCDEQKDERIRERWMAKNNRMKEIGVIEYYIEQSKTPRY